MTTEIIGWIATVLTSVSFLPQLFKIIKTKSTHDVSLWMILLIITASTIWIIFGILQHNPQLWVTNTIQVTVLLVILSYKMINIFKNKKLLTNE